MNNRRVTGWIAFFGICGLIAWMPEQFFGESTQDAASSVQPVAARQQAAIARARAIVASDAEKSEKVVVPQVDLFATQSWYVAPVISAEQQAALDNAVVAPSVPTAPPLPFQFIGKLEDSQQLQVFLQNGERLYVVRAGDVIDETYKIDRISATEMSLVYLPLKFAQTLSVGSAP
ncbi:hypothetical protein ACIPO9_11480 [Pseudomonas sp. NPDC090203]|jgi:hypothetical protein|uniref:hypothetical protein n=1 Tax=Pseudomonas TaxID=286 RepID=UPI00236338C1|nr:hypothetical protein [Pseudomonas putida]MDD1964343.1 hypothetical protein [Pseudomonas putida]